MLRRQLKHLQHIQQTVYKYKYIFVIEIFGLVLPCSINLLRRCLVNSALGWHFTFKIWICLSSAALADRTRHEHFEGKD